MKSYSISCTHFRAVLLCKFPSILEGGFHARPSDGFDLVGRRLSRLFQAPLANDPQTRATIKPPSGGLVLL